MEYLEPAATDIALAGYARKMRNAFIQVGFEHDEAFELTKVWFDHMARRAIDSAEVE